MNKLAKRMEKLEHSDYFGGAVLVDSACGSQTLSFASGATISFNMTDDPEYTLSGVYVPCERSERY